MFCIACMFVFFLPVGVCQFACLAQFYYQKHYCLLAPTVSQVQLIE